MNPFTEEPYSDIYLDQRKKLDQLPAYKALKKVEAAYVKNDVIIIKAKTGAGKGVVIAPFIMQFENVVGNKLQIDKPRKVVITEPRTVNTHVAEYIKIAVEAHDFVNYGHRFDNRLTEQTLLSFVTDGFLLNQFYDDPTLPNYHVLIIDEVHERNKNIDMLMMYAKEFLKAGKKENKKLVIMSATIDPKDYEKYYKDFKVGIVEIEGVSQPVKDIWEKSREDYFEHAIEVVKRLLDNADEEGDILAFLASGNELKKACRELDKPPYNKIMACFELYRGVPERIQEIIVDRDKYREIELKSGDFPQRKVVFSTNIAESGITVDGIRFVVESGIRYESQFDPKLGMHTLELSKISQAEAEQRRGRAGRTNPGTCIHLYSKEEFEKMPEQKTPEILSEEISDLVLSMMNESNTFKDVIDRLNKLMDPPSHEQLEFAKNKLEKLGLIAGGKITELGTAARNIPLDPQYAISLLAADALYVRREVALILAMINIEPRVEKYFYDTASSKTFNKFEHANGEIFSAMKLLDKFLSVKDRDKWARENYLSSNKLSKAVKYFFKLLRIIKGMEIPITVADEDKYAAKNAKIIKALSYGYHWQIANRVGKKSNMYELDNHQGMKISIQTPKLMKKLKKQIMYLDIRKIKGDVMLGGIINISKKMYEEN